MLVRLSRYAHLTSVGSGRVLVLHAVSQLRLVVDEEVAGLLTWFQSGRSMPDELDAAPVGPDLRGDTLAGCLATLVEQGVLTLLDPAEEEAQTASRLGETYGRDPMTALDAVRRAARRGGEPYWTVSAAADAAALAADASARSVLFFGDCDLQMEADFLRAAARRREQALGVIAAFPDDVRLAGERPHEAVFVGALRSRREVSLWTEDMGADPIDVYLREAQAVLRAIREQTDRPIFIDGLPVPTVQPLGAADRGPNGHRNRFRRLNLALETLTLGLEDVHFVDIDAVLSGAGARALLDDGLVGFTHFGSPGWMLQRPAAERAAVHDLFPDPAPLRDAIGEDPYARERLVAEAHLDALQVAQGEGACKCVILDLDGTLWPGVLAETGAPFAWTPEVSGPYSYIGLYFGLHEALLCLKRRGIVLACVSKNDEEVVRRLWTYPEGYPQDRLLSLEDFVTVRINWTDKDENIRSIAQELGFALSAFAFIDDHPVERARVQSALPDVLVLGEDPFALRRILLEDPKFQTPALTAEAKSRTDLVRAQLERQRSRARGDGEGFLADLEVTCAFERPHEGASLARVRELIARTTQFNATGRVFSAAELGAHASRGEVFVCRAKDRFGDYGLVAAAVVSDGDILAFVMSCRVIGLGVDTAFMSHLLAAMAAGAGGSGDPARAEARGVIHATDRNGPVRHLFADNGFTLKDGVWRRPLGEAAAAAA